MQAMCGLARPIVPAMRVCAESACRSRGRTCPTAAAAPMSEALVKLLLAYALGNLMGGAVVGRLRGGVDLRRVGSGNPGATNALRTQGLGFALPVLAIDAAKGALAVLLVPALPWPGGTSVAPETLAYVCGVGVVLGHCYPALLGFRGGKGVAALAGVFAALMPWGFLYMLSSFALTVMLSGYASLAALAAASAALLYVAWVAQSGLLSAAGAFTALMALLVVFKHRANLHRLLAGTEPRFERARFIGRWLERSARRPGKPPAP